MKCKYWILIVYLITGTVITKMDNLYFINPFSKLIEAKSVMDAVSKLETYFKKQNQELDRIVSITKIED